jgi:hypothetical protein
MGPAAITETSPGPGESLVGLEREVTVRFSERIDPATITAASFSLTANGAAIAPTRIDVAANELSATVFDAPFPASTEIRLVIDGAIMRGRDGQFLDADSRGTPGGTLTVDFTTLALTRIPNTDVEGFIRDAYNTDGMGVPLPIAGVTIRLDAFPGVTAVTNAQGYFLLEDVPAPDFFVHVDGTTATNPPPGFVYPSVGKAFHSVPGQLTTIPFNIHLPPMALSDIQPLSMTQPTDVGFGAAGICELQQMFPGADPALFQQMQVTIPPGGALDEQGTLSHRPSSSPFLRPGFQRPSPP